MENVIYKRLLSKLVTMVNVSKRKGGVLMKKLALRLSGCFASVALMVTMANVNAACIFIMHQPKLPAEAMRLKK